MTKSDSNKKQTNQTRKQTHNNQRTFAEETAKMQSSHGETSGEN